MITKHDRHLLELPAMPIFEAFGQDRFPDERSGYLDYREDVYGSVHDFEVYSQVDFLML